MIEIFGSMLSGLGGLIVVIGLASAAGAGTGLFFRSILPPTTKDSGRGRNERDTAGE
jgi:hypothetical protein